MTLPRAMRMMMMKKSFRRMSGKRLMLSLSTWVMSGVMSFSKLIGVMRKKMKEAMMRMPVLMMKAPILMKEAPMRIGMKAPILMKESPMRMPILMMKTPVQMRIQLQRWLRSGTTARRTLALPVAEAAYTKGNSG